MSKTIKLEASMGPQVLEFLGKYQALPDRGIVAGQSVASAIDAVFGRHPPVVNDIDIFRRVIADKSVGADMVNKTADRHQLSVARFENVYDTGYGDMSEVLRFIDTYSIQSVGRKDMLNFVNCTTPSAQMPLTVARVIAGFDLNCVRVGVDLSNGQLVWDRTFERFLATRQVEVAMLHTPNHTMVRLLRKLEQLPGVYGDVTAAAEICAGVAASRYLGKMVQKKQISTRFGKKLHEQSEEVQSGWSPYFSMQEHRFFKREGYEASGWLELTSQNEYMLEQGREFAEKNSMELWSLQAKGEIDRELQRKMDRLGGAVLTHGPRVVYDARRAKSKSVALKFAEMRGVFEAKRRSGVAWNMGLFGEAYVEGHALEDIGHKVDAFFDQHMGFAGPLMGLPLGVQYEAIKGIKAVAREFDGEASLGELELLASPAELLQPAEMRRLLAKEAEESKKPFNVKPMKLPALPRVFEGYVVRELLTKGELVKEGREVRHCVGGYSWAVRSNSSRVLSIRPKRGHDKTKWSTVELHDENHRSGNPAAFGPKAKLTVIQHRSYKNEEADSVNQAILDYLLAMHGKNAIVSAVIRLGFRSQQLEMMMKATRFMRRAVFSFIEGVDKLHKGLKCTNEFLEKMARAAHQVENPPFKEADEESDCPARDEPDTEAA